MFNQIPIFSDVARPFSYPVQKSASVNAVTIAAAFGTDYGNVNLMPQNYFVFSHFGCVTNYDNAGPVLTTTDVTASVIVAPPFVPDNFTVQIARGQNNVYSNQPLTQAEICSAGYLAGKQMPIPVVYGPRFNFQFTFTDTTGLFLLDSDDAAIPLTIQMFMVGYNVPAELWPLFLNYFPALANVFQP